MIGDALRQRELGREPDRGRARGGAQEGAAIEEHMLGRGAAFGHFPAAAANDVHGLIPPEFELAKQYGAAGSQASHGYGRPA